MLRRYCAPIFCSSLLLPMFRRPTSFPRRRARVCEPMCRSWKTLVWRRRSPKTEIVRQVRSDTIQISKRRAGVARAYIEWSSTLHRSPDVSPEEVRVGFTHHLAKRLRSSRPARGATCGNGEGSMDLLWTVAIILLIMWLLGLVTSYTLGGFIHILLVLAIVVVLIRVIQGRRPVL